MNSVNLGALPKNTVSEINSYIKRSFDSDVFLRSVVVCGEISNFSRQQSSGHLFFTLKDEKSQLKAVMFSREASALPFRPENGMKVLALGRIALYEQGGVYQIYVTALQPDGAGALALAFEQLKKKLAAEGLFDEKNKKKLPRFPKKIGVITSPTGAAVQDIFSILARRYPLAQIVFEPVSVQGQRAAYELTEAIKKFRRGDADVIIIGRGGGSAEDLWCFNDELLARAIAACEIPVVSAVGHETDFTICDFAADVRAATPSAAAELVTPDIADLMNETAVLTGRLCKAYSNGIAQRKEKLGGLLAKRDFSRAGHFFDSEKHRTEILQTRLSSLKTEFITAKKHELGINTQRLSSLNPLSVLLRGYSAVERDGEILGSAADISAGDTVTVRMSDGKLLCEVKDKWQNK